MAIPAAGHAVDRGARDRLAEVLRQFVSGRHTNFEFEALGGQAAAGSRDPAITAIRSAAWFLYDDIRAHRLKGPWELPHDGREAVARWIVFLHTDLPYEYSVTNFVSVGFWVTLLLTGPLFAIYNKSAWHVAALWAVYGGWWLFVARPRARRFLAEGDDGVWPFLRREQYERTLETPRLFAGSPIAGGG